MKTGAARRFAGLLASATLLGTPPARAAGIDLAAATCAEYEQEILPSTAPGQEADPIDIVMWLFGFSVAKSGERVMYGDSLTAFGFALDAACKNSPEAALLDAVSSVKSKRNNPMDLTRLDCATFEARHGALRKSDPESATTLMMWMFGYAVGVAGGRSLDRAAVGRFDVSLQDWCASHPADSLFDALSAPNRAVPHERRAAPRSAPQPARPSAHVR